MFVDPRPWPTAARDPAVYASFPAYPGGRSRGPRKAQRRHRYEWQSLHGALDGVRILVVDDNEDHLEIISAFLHRMGATVIQARGAKSALLLLREFRPMLVLADLMMPRVDGFKMLEEIRKLRLDDGGRIPIVAVSGHYDDATALRSGFSAFVPKPLDFQVLTDTILDVLPRPPR